MPVTSLSTVLPTDPTTIAQYVFPSPDFLAQAITIEPFDALRTPFAGSAYPMTVELQPAYVERGLIGPFEVLRVDPAGKHTREIVDVLPLVLMSFPAMGGVHQVTIKETAHMRWWGSATFNALGERGAS